MKKKKHAQNIRSRWWNERSNYMVVVLVSRMGDHIALATVVLVASNLMAAVLALLHWCEVVTTAVM